MAGREAARRRHGQGLASGALRKPTPSLPPFGAAMRAAKETGSLIPPAHILNAPTKMMREIGYGAGYHYDHDAQDALSGQDHFPDEMKRQAFYRPSDRGAEAAIGERMAQWAGMRRRRR